MNKAKGMVAANSLLFPVLVQAAEKSLELPQSLSAGYVFKLFAALLLVLVVFLLFAWGIKRLNRLPAGQDGVRVISGINVGSREKLIIVQIGDEQLLIGVTPASINKLHKLENKIPQNSSVKHPFRNALNGVLKSGAT